MADTEISFAAHRRVSVPRQFALFYGEAGETLGGFSDFQFKGSLEACKAFALHDLESVSIDWAHIVDLSSYRICARANLEKWFRGDRGEVEPFVVWDEGEQWNLPKSPSP